MSLRLYLAFSRMVISARTVLKGYNNEGHHRCQSLQNKVCSCCRQPNCSGFTSHVPQKLKATIPCHSCRRFFFNQQCYENHLRFTLSRQVKPENCVCLNVRQCKECGKQSNSFKAIRAHQCGTSQCPSCQKFVKATEHRCFIQPSKKTESVNKKTKEKSVPVSTMTLKSWKPWKARNLKTNKKNLSMSFLT